MGRRQARAQGKRAKRFGELLRLLRERQLGKRSSYEQVSAQLAERRVAQLSASGLHRYENEGRVPDVLAVIALADLYRVPEDWLLDALRADLMGEPLPPQPVVDDTTPISTLENEDEDVERFQAVRMLTDRIAAGPALFIDEARTTGHLAFSKRWLDRTGISRPLCIRLGPRERSMMPTFNPGDVVLLDCADERRLQPRTDHVYAVNVDGGSTLKRLVVVDGGIMLVSDNPDKEEYPTRALMAEEGQSVLDLIVGEVKWKAQYV